ncbi:hypothetical protein BH11PSE2_BH11PSE2_18370 [soil metagenome]
MRHDRRTILVGAGALATLTVAGAARAAETVKVRIPAAKTAFEPAEVTIKVGDSVEWNNRSVVTHTITCDPAKATVAGNGTLPEGAKPFDSGDLQQNTPWSQVFTVAGTYKYFCKEHETMPMVGTVIVTA